MLGAKLQEIKIVTSAAGPKRRNRKTRRPFLIGGFRLKV